MLVKDMMTRNVHLIDPNAAVTVAARKMRDQDVGSLLVGSGGQVMGMVAEAPNWWPVSGHVRWWLLPFSRRACSPRWLGEQARRLNDKRRMRPPFSR